MVHRLSKLITAGGMAAALAVGSVPKPASADTASTLTTLAGAAALIGGLVLYNNYQHKRQAANAIVGYTRNGGTVYGDGRIVMPNGQTIYPNSNGTYPWGQTAYYNPNANGYVYDTQRTGDYDTTHRHGRGHAYGHANGNNGNAYGHVNGNNGNAYGHGNGNNGNAYGHGNGNNGNAYGHGNGNAMHDTNRPAPPEGHAQQGKNGHGHPDQHGDEKNPH
jgi:hypothetical protein